MKWFKILIWIGIIYGIYGKQQLYFSSYQETNPNEASIRRVQTFLGKYQSPLQENAQDFVMAAKTYKIPYKVLVSISGVESTFGKNSLYNNPFGYFCGQHLCHFTNFKEAIWQVARTLGESNYYSDFRQTGSIQALSTNYNLGSQSWTSDVEYFINQI